MTEAKPEFPFSDQGECPWCGDEIDIGSVIDLSAPHGDGETFSYTCSECGVESWIVLDVKFYVTTKLPEKELSLTKAKEYQDVVKDSDSRSCSIR